MASKPDLGIKSAIGTKEEKINSMKVLRAIEKPQLIIDIVSILTIHHLKIADKMVEVYGKFGIAQCTLDTLREIIASRKGMGKKGFMTIGKEGNEYVRQEITELQVRENIEFLENLTNWVSENCEVLPCNAALKSSNEDKRTRKMLGGSFFDSMLIVSEKSDRILYSDDERFRSFASVERGCNGIWTQMLLMDMIARKLITTEDYAEATVGLVGLNYYYTSVNKESLVFAAEKSDWKYEGKFFAVMQKLREGSSDMDSAIAVVGEFLSFSWKKIQKDKKEALVPDSVALNPSFELR